MVDKLGATPALGNHYLMVGPVIKTAGAELTLAPGETASTGGKPCTLLESDTLNADTLVARINAVRALTYAFSAAATGSVTTMTILHNGLDLEATGDIVLPVACNAGKIGLATYLDSGVQPSNWFLDLYKNGVKAASSEVVFPIAGSWERSSVDWDTAVSFLAGDYFRVEMGGGDTAGDPRTQITALFNT